MFLGAAYYPEHRNPSRWEFDLDTMAEAGVNALRVGEFAWREFEPKDECYDFDWMDDFKEKAAKRGIRLLMCPPLRTVPAWLVEKDRTILLVRNDGVRLEYGSRYTFCINHPYLLHKGAALAEKMARHYGQDTSIIGWHLDNEHGDEPDCHCDICKRKFQTWCMDRYGDIKLLNERWGLAFWGLQFDHFEQIPTPATTKTFHSPGHLLAWRRFRSDSTVESVAMQADTLRKHLGGQQFITTNCQTWNPRTDYYDMSQHLDINGTNYYPQYGEGSMFDPWAAAICRSYKQRNFQVHELRNGAHMLPGAAGNTPQPGEVERLAVHCVANGADALFFFRWRACPFGCEQTHGTITDYDGRPKRIFNEVKHAFNRLTSMRGTLARTSIVSNMALFLDFPTRWIMESRNSWNGPRDFYTRRCRNLFTSLHRAGYSCDVVARNQDLSQYRLILVPALSGIDDDLARKFVDYVANGGTLVWHPLCGIKDNDAVIYPDRLHPVLKDMLKVDITEFATTDENTPFLFNWNGREYKGSHFCDLPVAHGAKVLGEFISNWFAGTPAITECSHGKGKVLYIMTFAELAFYVDLLQAIRAESGISRILNCTIPDSVEITERRAGDGTRFVFLINSSAEEQTLSIPGSWHDVYNEEDIPGSITLRSFGVAVLTPA